MTTFQRFVVASLVVAAGLCLSATEVWAQHGGGGGQSRFSDEPVPLADVPARPAPLLEIGEKFLGPGNLSDGFTLPTGAVWQPYFVAFGSLRSGLQGASQGGTGDFAEASGRFDLFGNLYLTQTERILVGIRPFDDDGRFTRYTIHADSTLPGEESGFADELNAEIRTLFFEGDIGEIFPGLDPDDSGSTDIYFSVGRQPLRFQDGLLISEDAIDMVGLTRSNMQLFELVNTRATAVFGWGDVDRLNRGDPTAKVFGLFTETDTRERTVQLDAMVVTADDARGDGLYGGISSTRRIGHYNNTLRVLGSYPLGTETPFNRKGLLVHNEFGWTPYHTHNWVYINAFGGIGQFRSAARSPSAGGPLGQTGVLFAAVGLGRYGAALGSRADNAVGGSVGYQWFFDQNRKQLLLEGGARYTYDKMNALGGRDAAAVGARYQMAAGRRFIIEVSGFGSYTFSTLPAGVSAVDAGGRFEVTIRL